MSPEIKLDPQIEEVLQDLSRDPRSKLFAVEPRKLFGLTSEIVSVSEHAAGWTSAERHLIHVHRERLADLLLEAARQKLLEVERSPIIDLPSRRRGRLPVPDGALDLGVAGIPGHPVADAQLILRALRGEGDDSDVTIEQLIHAAFRLVDDCRVRCAVAWNLLVSNQPREAAQLASRIQGWTSAALVRANCFEVEALAMDMIGLASPASNAATRAAILAEEANLPSDYLLMLRTSALVLAIEACELRTAANHVIALGDLAKESSAVQVVFIRALTARRDSGWTLAPESRMLASHLLETADQKATEILHVCL